MEIEFDDEKVKKFFDDFTLMSKKIGTDLTKLIKRRYLQLKAATTFFEYLSIGLGRPHSLRNDKKGLYAVSVTGNVRLIMEPISKDLSSESLKECKSIIIKGVVDYHGGKSTPYIP